MKFCITSVAAFFCFLTQVNAQLDVEDLISSLGNSGRPLADLERDPNRKAPEVLDFLGLEKGMKALDLVAIGGWYSEVLAIAVGPSGQVIMQNNPGRMVGNNIDQINERLSRRPNISHHIGPVSDLSSNSIDFALTALNFHDIYNRSAEEAHDRFTQVYDVLKPGGVLVLSTTMALQELITPRCIGLRLRMQSNLLQRWDLLSQGQVTY